MRLFNDEDVILVTGASSGLGRALALLLCAEGAKVLACGRNRQSLEVLACECGEGARCIPVVRDLCEDMQALPSWVLDLAREHGKLSGLACVAGADAPLPLALFSKETAQSLLEINYLAPMLLARGFADRRANVGKGAAMLFMASIAASSAQKGKIAYAGSKGALVASVRSIALEVAAYGIRANCLSPGAIETAMFNDEASRFYSSSVLDTYINPPLGRGTPEDPACLAAFLLSRKAGWITGQNFIVDGGSGL